MTMIRKYNLAYVVGNGPNAYLATKLLLERGCRVVVIDSDQDLSEGSNFLEKPVLKNREIKKNNIK